MARVRAIDFCEFAETDRLAAKIAQKYTEWEILRRNWLEITHEVRDYIFATDTRSTTAGKVGWKNSTHIPKLCQIRDNLHANYMAALFPNDRSVIFEADDEESLGEKKVSVEAYMRNKLRLGDFRTEVSKLILDWIDYGNCFALVEFMAQQHIDPYGQKKSGYIGPKVQRISPLDIVFNPTSSDFTRTPKIIRTLSTLADLQMMIEDYPEMGYLQEVFDKQMYLRERMTSPEAGGLDVKKNAAYLSDGFSSFKHYYDSDYVEILEFYGDIYDSEERVLHRNQHIVVVDRAYIIKRDEHPNWFGRPPIFHAGWRQRQDNLYAMGPLDNLVGMQYRIDHLENTKADGLDMIIHPVFKVIGEVEEFTYGPNERIYASEDGDVQFMHPDASVLQLNTEIQMIMQLMEEMAGAPRQAMGFRTPGEKTKFEVQVLENGANRVFINKTSHFEVVFLEPILNAMLETARRNFGPTEKIQIQDTDFNFKSFLEVTKEDITASGNIRAVGARRFAQKANMLQDLVNFSNTPLAQNPRVLRHFSGYKMAQLVEDLLEINEYDIVERDIAVTEEAESAELMSQAEQVIGERDLAGQG